MSSLGQVSRLAAALLAGWCGLAACSGSAPPSPPSDAALQDRSLHAVLADADEAFKDQAYAVAQDAYQEVLRLDPENARAAANLATCYLHGRQVRKAQDLLESFVARHPDDVPTRLVLARVFVRQADMVRGAEILAGVLAVEPDLLMARYNLGFIDYRLRRYETALVHLGRAVELRPEFPEAHYSLGLTWLALGRLDEAIAALEQAVALDPRHLGARFNLMNACARAGRSAEWRKHQVVFAELSGRSKAQQEREAQIKASSVEAIRLIQQGRLPEALAAYEALSRTFPDHAPFHNEIGRLHHRLGRRDEARRALLKAVELDARLSQPHYILAEIYREAGEPDASRRELEIFAALETIPEGKTGY